MRKFLYLLLVVGLLSGSYLIYNFWIAPQKSNSWDFIPKNAALVLETDKTIATYDSIKILDVWRALDDAQFVANIELQLAKLDSMDSEHSLRRVFEKSSSLIAFFPVSVSELDVLLVMKLNSSDQRNFLSRCVAATKESGYRFKTRIFNGFTIEELYKQTGGEVFSFIRYQDHLIGSFSPFLVEDAIRAYIDRENNSFLSEFQETKSLTPLAQDEGNIYVNMPALGAILNLFTEERNEFFGRSAFLDMDFEASSLKLVGFTFQGNGLLSTFPGGPGSFNLLDVVPNNTARLAHFSFENANDWRVNLIEFDEKITLATNRLRSEFDVDADFLFSQIDQEIGVADLEVVGTENPDRLIFFDTKNISETEQFLRQAAKRMASDSVFSDRMGEYIVRKLDVGITEALVGNRSALEKECYYIIHREYVIMSSSLAQIKRLIVSLQSDNTWRRSLQINNLLDLSSREANYSLIVQVPRSWKQLMHSLKPSWKPVFSENQAGFQSIEYISYQCSKVDDRYYTNAIAYQPNAPKQPAKVVSSNRIALPTRVISKPIVIRNHINQAFEVLVQDSILQLYHLSDDLKVLWATRLSEKIVEPIIPVDFYQNSKTQYAFCTSNQLHIIDRTGAYIEGYPKRLPSENSITHFSVVDYDGSKNYRFMLTDSEGDIYLLDKSGNTLQGWAPKSTGAFLKSAPKHIRVAGKDAFIIHKRNGVIDLVNRRGASYGGFPMDLKSDLVETYFSEASGSFETSGLTTLTEGGEIVRINFTGELEHREQLFKPSTNTQFSLIPDVLRNTFIIVRDSESLWEVLDERGTKLFEKTYLKDRDRIVQFYRFGGGRALILVTSTTEQLLTIYDMDGKIITQKPLQSSQPVSVLFLENSNWYTLYLAHDSVIEKTNVK